MDRQPHEPYILFLYNFHHEFLEEKRDEITANTELNIDMMAY